MSLVVLLAGCNQEFQPKAEYREQLVVFSILATNRSEQLVRVYTTYNPIGMDPSTNREEKLVTNALVTLNDGANTYTLRDTLLTRLDTSRYRTPMSAYVTNRLTARGGLSYALNIHSPAHQPVAARITLPEHGTLSLAGSRVVERPGSGARDEQISITAYSIRGAAGIVIRMYVDYEVEMEGMWMEGRVEVPEQFPTDDFPFVEVAYPNLRRFVRSPTSIRIPKSAYLFALSRALTSHPARRLRFTRVVFFLLQAEHNLFAYYNTANAFFDRGSIRTDQPNHSNISGGIGLFGGYTADSLVVPLPEDFGYNRR
jgi:hypothetical protein